MSRFQTRRRTAVLLASAAALACACTSTEPIKPASLTIVSGDSQRGLVGAAVHDSLVVTVVGSDGRGFPGASVTWAVASGGASVSPATSASDAGGRAASKATLGTGAGAVTITATVVGVTSVTFHLTAVAACAWREPFGVPATASGLLSSADCLYSDGSYVDYYGLSLSTQRAARIRLVSSAFDAFLLLTDSGGAAIAADDDDATSTNSEILILMAPGSYVVGANSYLAGETGAYTLTSAAISEDISACAVWVVMPGVQTSQQLTSSDCTSGSYYADLMAVPLREGRTYTITQRSTAFNSYLYLANSSGTTVASDDDGGGGNDARIVYTPSTSGLYVIVAASFSAGSTGAYSLTISSPSAAGVAGSAGRAVAKLRQRGVSWPELAAARVPRSPKQRQ